MAQAWIASAEFVSIDHLLPYHFGTDIEEQVIVRPGWIQVPFLSQQLHD